jgi:hypothetical protein
VLFRRGQNVFALFRLNVYKGVPVPSIHKVHSFVFSPVISAIWTICLHFHFFSRNLLAPPSPIGPSPETKRNHPSQKWNVNAVTYVLFNQHNKVYRGSDSNTTQSTWILHSVRGYSSRIVNHLCPELNPICYLVALLAHDFLHVSRIRVKSLTLRLLMSYIYIYIYIYIYMTLVTWGLNYDLTALIPSDHQTHLVLRHTAMWLCQAFKHTNHTKNTVKNTKNSVQCTVVCKQQNSP